MQDVAEQLTQQFYDWELETRGWSVYEHAIEPEPPFRPFPGHYLEEPVERLVDDGRHPELGEVIVRALGRVGWWVAKKSWSATRFSCKASWFGSRWTLAKVRRRPVPVWPTPVPEPEPEPTNRPTVRLDERETLQAIAIVLPPGVTYGKDRYEQLLLNLTGCTAPVCMEWLGLPGQVSLALVVDEVDAPLVMAQLASHFPEAIVTVGEDELGERWDPHCQTRIVECGLADECMVPLRSYRSFDTDPLLGMVATLGSLQAGELACVQFLWQPARFPWAASIKRAVTAADGEPFFADAPEITAAAYEKLASPLYGVVVRVAAQCEQGSRHKSLIRSLVSNLGVTTNPRGNRLIPLINDAYSEEPLEQDWCLVNRCSQRTGMLWSLDELLTLVHLPGASVAAPALVRNVAKTKLPPAGCISDLGGHLCLGQNVHEGEYRLVFQSLAQRLRHTHLIGASGSGKSTLMAWMIQRDIEDGRGVGVLDPHGDLIDRILDIVPPHRVDDVVLLDLADEDFPVPFNILSAHSDLEKNLLASDLAAAFRRLATSWGDQMTACLSNGILAILESERGGTLMDLRRFLVEPKFRANYLESVTDPEVRYYWQHEFPLVTGKPQASVVTRLNTFLRAKPIRHMVAQGDNRLDIAGMMDGQKIFLARIPQGAIGEENAYLLGTLLVSAFQRAALCRQGVEAKQRAPFFLYLDEFHEFITPSMAQILSGARKYGLGLILAHQEMRQLESRDGDVASAVLANPSTRICFRIGDTDAKRLESGFSAFDARDLQNLPVGEAIARVERADGDFNLSVLEPLPLEGEGESQTTVIRERSRERYAVPRSEVEERLAKQHEEREEKAGKTAKKTKAAKTSKTAGAKKPSPADTPEVSDAADVPAVTEAEQDSPAELVPSPPKEEIPPPEPASDAGADAIVSAGDAARPDSDPSDAVVVPAPAATPGRGGTKHKSLQRLIKHWAEGMGYGAQIEKTILNGRGAVDVVVTTGKIKVAVEISITTPTAHECRNLEKCLKAEFDHVVMVTDDPAHLKRIRRKIKEKASSSEFDRVSFMTPPELFSFIEGLEKPAAKSDTTVVRGYRVKVERASIDPADRAARMQSVKRTVADAASRKAKKDGKQSKKKPKE